MKEHTCKAKHMHKRTHSYISADLCECEFYQMSNVYETGWYSISSFDALLTQTDTTRQCYDWKWNKNQKSLGITYTDRPLTEAYERAIVADLFFFLQVFLLRFQVLLLLHMLLPSSVLLPLLVCLAVHCCFTSFYCCFLRVNVCMSFVK